VQVIVLWRKDCRLQTNATASRRGGALQKNLLCGEVWFIGLDDVRERPGAGVRPIERQFGRHSRRENGEQGERAVLGALGDEGFKGMQADHRGGRAFCPIFLAEAVLGLVGGS
jgi:hypothetical protein